MKFRIIFLLLLSFFKGFSQEDGLLVIHNDDVALLLNKNPDGFYTENITFQGDDLSGLNLADLEANFSNFIFDGNKITLITSGNEYVLNSQINSNSGSNIFSGYGISRRLGRFVFESSKSDFSIFNLIHTEAITYDDLIVMSANTCHSGGEGSSECSSSGWNLVTTECSVKCRDTHYACCDDTKNECTCVKIEAKDDKKSTPPKAIPIKTISQSPMSISNGNMSESINFKIYPNPVDNTFKVESSDVKKDFKIYVVDINGKILERFNSIKYPINVENYSDGVYVIKILNELNHEIYNAKIVKK